MKYICDIFFTDRDLQQLLGMYTHGSGVYMGLELWRMYWVEWNTRKARPAKKSREERRPATGRRRKPVDAEKSTNGEICRVQFKLFYFILHTKSSFLHSLQASSTVRWSYTAGSVRCPLAVGCCPHGTRSTSPAVEKHGCVRGRHVWGTESSALEKPTPTWPSLQPCIQLVE